MNIRTFPLFLVRNVPRRRDGDASISKCGIQCPWPRFHLWRVSNQRAKADWPVGIISPVSNRGSLSSWSSAVCINSYICLRNGTQDFRHHRGTTHHWLQSLGGSIVWAFNPRAFAEDESFSSETAHQIASWRGRCSLVRGTAKRSAVCCRCLRELHFIYLVGFDVYHLRLSERAIPQ